MLAIGAPSPQEIITLIIFLLPFVVGYFLSKFVVRYRKAHHIESNETQATNIFEKHKRWWVVLLAAMTLVSVFRGFTSQDGHIFAYAFGGVLAYFIGCYAFAGIVWVFCKMIGRRLSTEEFMSYYTAAFVFCALVNVVVSCARVE